jgi:hypothetical protein
MGRGSWLRRGWMGVDQRMRVLVRRAGMRIWSFPSTRRIFSSTCQKKSFFHP